MTQRISRPSTKAPRAKRRIISTKHHEAARTFHNGSARVSGGEGEMARALGGVVREAAKASDDDLRLPLPVPVIVVLAFVAIVLVFAFVVLGKKCVVGAARSVRKCWRCWCCVRVPKDHSAPPAPSTTETESEEDEDEDEERADGEGRREPHEDARVAQEAV